MSELGKAAPRAASQRSIHSQAMQALQPPPSVEAGLAKAQARLSLAAQQPGLDTKALLAAVPQHLAFLRAAHRAGVSLRAPSAKTLERYASKWLPLLATADEGAALAPPPSGSRPPSARTRATMATTCSLER